MFQKLIPNRNINRRINKGIKMKRRKIFCLFLVFTMLLGQYSAFAVDNKDSDDVMPAYVHIAMMAGRLTIGNTGKAHCGADVDLDKGYNVDVTMELLKYDDGDWNSIKSWTTSGSGPRGVVFDQDYWLNDADMYKVKVTAYVTDANGKYVESPSCYSVICKYTK